VRALRVTDDGSLWVGFGATGGIARIRGKVAHIYNDAEASRIGGVTSIEEDRAHTVWSGQRRVVSPETDRWEKLGAANGLPEEARRRLRGQFPHVVIGTAAGLYWRPEATEEKFQEIEPSDDPFVC